MRRCPSESIGTAACCSRTSSVPSSACRRSERWRRCFPFTRLSTTRMQKRRRRRDQGRAHNSTRANEAQREAAYPQASAADLWAGPGSAVPDLMAEFARAWRVFVPSRARTWRSFRANRSSSASTARIHGSVRFTAGSSNRAQPMSGVNVVARWIDPATRKPSTQFALASV